MGQERFYLRVRDQVTGPFRLAQLKLFRIRGQLQPHHEVSEDELVWLPAASIPGLFPGSTVAPARSAGIRPRESGPLHPPPLPSAAPARSSTPAPAASVRPSGSPGSVERPTPIAGPRWGLPRSQKNLLLASGMIGALAVITLLISGRFLYLKARLEREATVQQRELDQKARDLAQQQREVEAREEEQRARSSKLGQWEEEVEARQRHLAAKEQALRQKEDELAQRQRDLEGKGK